MSRPLAPLTGIVAVVDDVPHIATGRGRRRDATTFGNNVLHVATDRRPARGGGSGGPPPGFKGAGHTPRPRGPGGTDLPAGPLSDGAGASRAGCGGAAHSKGAPAQTDSVFSARFRNSS